MIPSSGSAQNGWSRLVHASPCDSAMTILWGATCKRAAASITTGPCTAHWPPPEGTSRFTRPADKKVSGAKLLGLVLVAYSIAVSTVLFQTVTNNRILTPSIMGFDALFILIQTVIVFFFTSRTLAVVDTRLQFVAEVAAMVGFSVLLFRWLFIGGGRSLHLLVLVGIVFGVLFRSLSNLMQRLINPNDFVLLQDALFASFNAIAPDLLAVATAAMFGVSLLLLPLLPRLDVLMLGREPAISLGVDHVRTVSLVLAVIAVLVSVSTALVGPVLFFGLLVANLAYLIMPGFRHLHVLPAAVLLAVIALVGGQALLEHVFGYDTALAIIIEFAGGLAFLFILLRGRAR